MSRKPQIRPAVVSGVSVDVINNQAWVWVLAGMQLPDDAVKQPVGLKNPDLPVAAMEGRSSGLACPDAPPGDTPINISRVRVVLQ